MRLTNTNNIWLIFAWQIRINYFQPEGDTGLCETEGPLDVKFSLPLVTFPLVATPLVAPWPEAEPLVAAPLVAP